MWTSMRVAVLDASSLIKKDGRIKGIGDLCGFCSMSMGGAMRRRMRSNPVSAKP